MRAFRSVTLALAFATGLASMVAAQSPTPQPLHYWHVWVDSAGMTHQTQCEFKDFSPLSLGKDVVGDAGRRAHHAHVYPVGSQGDIQRRLLE
jgi:hypothetical protein